ncbi:MAG: glycosyltransferase family 2 protein [Phycisphaeraceae bacterium]
MNPLPRITIITPSYNQGAFLERTIRSVLDQGYENLEYFVIDGGSTGQSVEIIGKHKDHLAHWVSEPDTGQTDAINKGLARATGDIIAYLNSDDVLLPGVLATIAPLMAEPNAARWVVGRCTRIDAEDRPLEPFDLKSPDSFVQYLMRTSGFLPQPSSFWSADLFARYGGFDRTMHYSFDYEFNCRLLAGGETPLLIDKPLAALRVHDQSKGESQADGFVAERFRVAQRYAPQLPWPERWRLYRDIGYRKRLVAIRNAQQAGSSSLWSHVLRRPWWLGSEDIRKALCASTRIQRKAA